MTLPDDPAPRDHDVAHEAPPRTEDRGVEQILGRLLDQPRIVRVEHDEIRARAQRDRADRLRERLRTASESSANEREPARFTVLREEIAPLASQPLRGVDQSQLREGIHTDMAVAADADTAASGEIIDRRENA